MARITVIIGHPFRESLNHSLAAEYVAAAQRSGSEVRVIDLAEIQFPLTPRERNELWAEDLAASSRLGPEIHGMLEAMDWAHHLVFFYPSWWGTYPAVLKGFIDRVVLTGIAYQGIDGSPRWIKKWTSKTARLIYTMDAPSFFNRFMYRKAGENSLKYPVLWYVGVKTIGATAFAPVKGSTLEKRQRWLKKTSSLGAKDGVK